MNDARVIVCRGARATEARLLAEVGRLRPRRPEELRLPLRVVVPSRGLRVHVAARVVEALGPVAGVIIQTAQGLALEVLERAGQRPLWSDAATAVEIRRLAPAERVLREALDHLENGYGALTGVVRDLLDAGFTAAHEDGVAERLAELGGVLPHGRLARALAIVRLTAQVDEALAAAGVVRPATAPALATEVLRADPEQALSASAILVHGFADVTGLTADLLAALLMQRGASVLVDRPPDPAGDGDDAGCRYLERLGVRLGGATTELDEGRLEPARVELVEARNPEEEACWLAGRLRALLDDGVAPESVLVVCRDLEARAPRLRRHLTRLGVPFSGAGVTVPGGVARVRLEGLVELVGRGSALELDRWVELLDGAVAPTELRLGLRVVGLRRLGDLVGLDVERHHPKGVDLPMSEIGDEDGPAERPKPATLGVEALSSAVRSARELAALLEGWPSRATAAEHGRHTRAVAAALGWLEDGEASRMVGELMTALEEELPAAFELDRDELGLLLGERVAARTAIAIGGAGGGVQLATVTGARALTASHLFLLGLERGVLPRPVVEDPLLPDAVRGHLASDVLPEMPVAARRADEERYLFAQLLSAAPVVTVSWCRSSDGRRRAPSTFVDRLRMARGLEQASARLELEDARPRPALEHAVAAGLRAGGGTSAEVLAVALDEGRRLTGVDGWRISPQVLALARAAVAAALEPGRDGAGPGPWDGLVGDLQRARDRTPPVTRLEAIARCPWQTFVVRRLGVAPMADPLRGLPDLGPGLVGEVVHAVLDQLVVEALGARVATVGRAATREPTVAPWPDRERLEELLRRAAERALREAGLTGLGMTSLLTARVRPVLAVAERVVGPTLGRVLGSEVEDELEVPGLGRRLRFRADRVDLVDDRLGFVDYKTGKPVSDKAKPETRRRELLKKVGLGTLLQGVAYALAAPRGRGAYVSLSPVASVVDDALRTTVIEHDDTALVNAFRWAVERLLRAWDLGAMPPRVSEPGRPDQPAAACRSCAVAEACLREDSGLRHRLVGWLESDAPDSRPPVVAARELWWLGRREAAEEVE